VPDWMTEFKRQQRRDDLVQGLALVGFSALLYFATH